MGVREGMKDGPFLLKGLSITKIVDDCDKD